MFGFVEFIFVIDTRLALSAFHLKMRIINLISKNLSFLGDEIRYFLIKAMTFRTGKAAKGTTRENPSSNNRSEMTLRHL